MLISPKKQGMTANVSYPYIGPTYVNAVVTINRYQYYFGISILVSMKTEYFVGANLASTNYSYPP